MAKTYYVSWPSTATGDPRTNFGLAPTFLIFNTAGSAVTPPSISTVTGATGIYQFVWGTTTPIAFLIDGFTTGLGANRYITGSIDPVDSVNEQVGNMGITLVAIGNTTNISMQNQGFTLIGIGNTSIAQGNTILANITGISGFASQIGSIGSTFGGQSTDPIDLFGYLKRLQENLEGDNIYSKAIGDLKIYSRGMSTLLRDKTIANGVSTVTKTGV